jgi:hypothetical protein
VLSFNTKPFRKSKTMREHQVIAFQKTTKLSLLSLNDRDSTWTAFPIRER